MIIFDIIFGIFFVSIVFTLYFYYPLIKFLARNKKLKKKNWEPNITILIPIFNEEKCIKQKIRNLLGSDYPKKKMKILVIDNGSTDKSLKIAKKFEKKYPVSVLSSSLGKTNALNKGLEKTKTEIVIVSDADSTLEKKSIRNLVGYLHNGVGGVGGYTVVKKKHLWYMKNKLNYHKKDWNMRFYEGLVNNTCSLDGKLLAFKKSIIDRFPLNTLADDYELTFLIKKKGLRSIIAKDAVVYEEAPSSTKEEVKQIRRRVALGINANFKFANFLFDKRYKEFGFLIFPARRFFPFLFPFFTIYILLYLFSKSVLLGLAVISASITYALIFNRYIVLQWWAVLLAYYDVLSGKIYMKKNWEKIIS